MFRLLIADSSDSRAKQISKHLRDTFLVRHVAQGENVLREILLFEPDILLLDLMMPDVEGIQLLRTLQNAGSNVRVIAVSAIVHEHIAMQLALYGVSQVIRTPCTVGMLVTSVRDLKFSMEHPDCAAWCLENETDSILLSLGFRMGPSRYRCVFEAILERYRMPESSMKELYINVAIRCGGNYQRVEKAIRNAVEDAYEYGDRERWRLFFSNSPRRDKPYPSNEDFVSRIAGGLAQRTRVRKPYSYSMVNVK